MTKSRKEAAFEAPLGGRMTPETALSTFIVDLLVDGTREAMRNREAHPEGCDRLLRRYADIIGLTAEVLFGGPEAEQQTPTEILEPYDPTAATAGQQEQATVIIGPHDIMDASTIRTNQVRPC